jgi:error-prone DNA polymerase
VAGTRRGGGGRARAAPAPRLVAAPDEPRPDEPRPAGDGPAWAELHCHSPYSFLDGASSPEELVAEAAAGGLAALAITDHDGTCGAARALRRNRGGGGAAA